MRKDRLIGIVGGIVVSLVLFGGLSLTVYAARTQPQQPQRYWQDVIRKPTANWSGNVLSGMPEATQAILALDRLFGRIAENDSQLASSAWEHENGIKILSARIAALTKRIDALEASVVEPNEVTTEDPNVVE